MGVRNHRRSARVEIQFRTLSITVTALTNRPEIVGRPVNQPCHGFRYRDCRTASRRGFCRRHAVGINSGRRSVFEAARRRCPVAVHAPVECQFRITGVRGYRRDRRVYSLVVDEDLRRERRQRER